jgi:hypothetical protein
MATQEEETRTGATASVTGTIGWGPPLLVRVLLGFWALWWSIVFATNFFDGLVQLGLLGDGWTLASGNYGFLLSVTEVHGTPASVVALLFAAGVVWELGVALLTWRAFASSLGGLPSRRLVYRALVPAVGFFGAFLLLTEVFLAYDLANTHVRLFIATLLTLFVVDQWL